LSQAAAVVVVLWGQVLVLVACSQMSALPQSHSLLAANQSLLAQAVLAATRLMGPVLTALKAVILLLLG
jgi:hypothetical protein